VARSLTLRKIFISGGKLGPSHVVSCRTMQAHVEGDELIKGDRVHAGCQSLFSSMTQKSHYVRKLKTRNVKMVIQVGHVELA
jgi:hypothetical protein